MALSNTAHTDDVFSRAKAMVSRAFIESEFHTPGAYWKQSSRGHMEYYTRNPLRQDDQIGSFSISETGLYSDFADPNCKGDAIDLLSLARGITPLEAAQFIAGVTNVTPFRAPEAPHAPALEEPQELLEPTSSPGTPPGALVTKYTDNDTGKTAFFVVRIDKHDGKIIYPVSWDGKEFVKRIWSWYKKRPMMRPKYKDGLILVVEGEKKQTVAQKYFDDLDLRCSVITWHGGANAVKMLQLHHDLSSDALNDRLIVGWPDNDDVGIQAMVNIKKMIPRMIIMQPPNDKPKAWDIADSINENGQPEEMIAGAVTGDWPIIEAVVEEAVEDDDSAIVEKDQPKEEIKKDPPKPGHGDNFPLTDLGNAERIVSMFGKNIRYNHDKKAWCVFKDGIWKSDDPAAMTPMIKEVINRISEIDWKFANKCESLSSINNMLTLASRETGIPVNEPDFDKDRHTFMAANGLVDLRRGELIESTPEMLISKRGQVAFNKDAECPKFKAFLDDITLGNGEMQEFMRRWFGLCLSGDMSAQSFAIFYGCGANGKSTITETISRIIGDYSKTAAAETFTVKQTGSGIPNDVAALRGARMVLASETESNAKLAESRVKQMTGEDKISARFMRGEFFEFQPSWKIIISTNHRPRISGGDHGIWRRVILVPFDFVCPDEKMNPNLPAELWEEREGILSWMVGGAMDYFKDGGGRKSLKIPRSMTEATEEYRVDEDVLGRFLQEECYTKEDITSRKLPDRAPSGLLMKILQVWAEKNNELAFLRISSVQFGKAMKERGFEPCRTTNGSRGYMWVYPKNIEQGEN